MKARFAFSLALVAAASALLGFAVAEYTSATRHTAAAPAPLGVAATGAATAESATIVLPDFADIAERANPAVVGITTTGGDEKEGERRRSSDPYHWFFGPGTPGQRGPSRSMGSG